MMSEDKKKERKSVQKTVYLQYAGNEAAINNIETEIQTQEAGKF